MAVVKNLMVRAGADFSAITKQANKANKSMQSMQQKFSRSCKGMQTAFNGLKTAMGALGVVLSLGAIVSASKDAYEAYTQQAEGETKLQHVMRRTMDASNDEVKSILDLCAAQQQLGIVGDEVQYAGAQELATYLEQSKSLKKLIPVMNDMVAQQYGYNATAENATNIATMLGKVMEGQTGALSRYGYYFTDAQAAILKYGNEEQRAATLADVVSASVGGMNQALAMTPVGRMVQLKNTMSDVQESFGQAVSTIGTAFLPLLQRVAGGLQTIANFANRVAQSIAEAFGGEVSTATYDMTPAIVSYGDALDDATDSANKTANATKNLSTAAFDTITKLSGGSDTESDSDGKAVPFLSADSGAISSGSFYTGTAAKSFGQFTESLEKLKKSLDRLKDNPVFQQIVEGIKNVGGTLISSTITLSINELSDALDLLNDVLSGDWKNAGKDLKAMLDDLDTWGMTNETSLVNGFLSGRGIDKQFNADEWTAFRKSSSPMAITKWLFGENNSILDACMDDAGALVKRKWDDITSQIETKFAPIKAKFEDTKEAVTKKWEQITGNIKAKVIDIKAKIATSWSSLKTTWNNLMSNFKDKTVNITTKINATVTDLKSWLNTNVIDKLNAKIHSVRVGGVSVFRNVSIPHLAQGGYLRANNPTLAVVGDNTTQGEIVAPEGKLAAMAREAAMRVMSGATTAMRMAQVALSTATVNRPGSIDRGGASGDMDDVILLMRKLLTAVEDGHVIELDKKYVGRTNRAESSRIARANGYA
ncbi:MAG: hypothetical protein Q3985_01195 [Eubacteriales bacterium]|nr:hypothetical protein [Eubacteriales bacterium]